MKSEYKHYNPAISCLSCGKINSCRYLQHYLGEREIAKLDVIDYRRLFQVETTLSCEECKRDNISSWWLFALLPISPKTPRKAA